MPIAPRTMPTIPRPAPTASARSAALWAEAAEAVAASIAAWPDDPAPWAAVTRASTWVIRVVRSVSVGSLVGNWMAVGSLNGVEGLGPRRDGEVDLLAVDRAGQVERVVARLGRHDRGVVLAVRAEPGVGVERRVERERIALLAVGADDDLEVVGSDIVDRLAGRIGDDHLDGVDFTGERRLMEPADGERVRAGVLDGVGRDRPDGEEDERGGADERGGDTPRTDGHGSDPPVAEAPAVTSARWTADDGSGLGRDPRGSSAMRRREAASGQRARSAVPGRPTGGRGSIRRGGERGGSPGGETGSAAPRRVFARRRAGRRASRSASGRGPRPRRPRG